MTMSADGLNYILSAGVREEDLESMSGAEYDESKGELPVELDLILRRLDRKQQLMVFMIYELAVERGKELKEVLK